MNAQVQPRVLPLILIGALAGAMAGLFGIGGGTIIMPALILWIGMSPHLAAGTSVATIVPTALVGAISYALQGNIDWVVGACLVVGVVGGAQLGSYLLPKIPHRAVVWSFVAFLVCVIISLWLVVPSRDDAVHLSLLSGVMLTVMGFLTGVFSTIVGVGGGIIVVPALMLFFGSNDLVAKGSSLLMMAPGAFTATINNFKRSSVHLRAAVTIAATASLVTPFSSYFATLLNPLLANILFSMYVIVILVQMVIRNTRSAK